MDEPIDGRRLEALEPFIGEWDLDPTFSFPTPEDATGRVVFEWMTGGRFLIERWEVSLPEAPDGIAIIGPDEDGGGLLNLADFLIEKHPNARLAAISSTHDQIMRLFFSMGLGNCVNIDTSDPVAITLLQGLPDVYYPADRYESGIVAVKNRYLSSGRMATYLMGHVSNREFHQHIFRQRLFEPAAGGTRLVTVLELADPQLAELARQQWDKDLLRLKELLEAQA
jgi:hypothetical protein